MNSALVIYIHGKGGNTGEEAANRKDVSCLTFYRR